MSERLPREQQRCGNCTAFVRVANGGKGGGQCRGEFPKMMPTTVPIAGSIISAQGPQFQQGVASVWPPMNENEWCRRWE